ncbi:unnamed protein product [Taenia asiatica]|uniref:Uncharacterized protein n=1 Tax=Taenia asiatica TaxID=60517 RepID=A0A0R3W4V3_TAEAS|nr:unnamed protein product [Taenia asiatica]
MTASNVVRLTESKVGEFNRQSVAVDVYHTTALGGLHSTAVVVVSTAEIQHLQEKLEWRVLRPHKSSVIFISPRSANESQHVGQATPRPRGGALRPYALVAKPWTNAGVGSMASSSRGSDAKLSSGAY